MNIRETLRNVGRAIRDELQEMISDPDQVAAFPAHLRECTRSKFLQITWQGTGIPNWSGAASNITGKTITCVECGGAVIKKFK